MSFFDEVLTTVENTRFLQAVQDAAINPIDIPFRSAQQLSDRIDALRKSTDISLTNVIGSRNLLSWTFLKFLSFQNVMGLHFIGSLVNEMLGFSSVSLVYRRDLAEKLLERLRLAARVEDDPVPFIPRPTPFEESPPPLRAGVRLTDYYDEESPRCILHRISSCVALGLSLANSDYPPIPRPGSSALSETDALVAAAVAAAEAALVSPEAILKYRRFRRKEARKAASAKASAASAASAKSVGSNADAPAGKSGAGTGPAPSDPDTVPDDAAPAASGAAPGTANGTKASTATKGDRTVTIDDGTRNHSNADGPGATTTAATAAGAEDDEEDFGEDGDLYVPPPDPSLLWKTRKDIDPEVLLARRAHDRIPPKWLQPLALRAWAYGLRESGALDRIQAQIDATVPGEAPIAAAFVTERPEFTKETEPHARSVRRVPANLFDECLTDPILRLVLAPVVTIFRRSPFLDLYVQLTDYVERDVKVCPSQLHGKLAKNQPKGEIKKPGYGVGTNAQTISDYKFFRVLGRGAFGAVSAAQHKTTLNVCAVKQMSKRMIKAADKGFEWMVLNERRMLKAMHSPFVLGLQASLQDKNNLYLLLDMCLGGDLSYHLRQAPGRRFTVERARFYFAQILLGLEHMHNMDIVYRDLKPANVLLDSNGNAKLSDLGLSIRLHRSKPLRHVAGTAGYWAPEVPTKNGTTKASDYWSLGVVLYEFFTGHRPHLVSHARRDYTQRVPKGLAPLEHEETEAAGERVLKLQITTDPRMLAHIERCQAAAELTVIEAKAAATLAANEGKSAVNDAGTSGGRPGRVGIRGSGSGTRSTTIVAPPSVSGKGDGSLYGDTGSRASGEGSTFSLARGGSKRTPKTPTGSSSMAGGRPGANSGRSAPSTSSIADSTHDSAGDSTRGGKPAAKPKKPKKKMMLRIPLPPANFYPRDEEYGPNGPNRPAGEGESFVETENGGVSRGDADASVYAAEQENKAKEVEQKKLTEKKPVKRVMISTQQKGPDDNPRGTRMDNPPSVLKRSVGRYGDSTNNMNVSGLDMSRNDMSGLQMSRLDMSNMEPISRAEPLADGEKNSYAASFDAGSNCVGRPEFDAPENATAMNNKAVALAAAALQPLEIDGKMAPVEIDEEELGSEDDHFDEVDEDGKPVVRIDPPDVGVMKLPKVTMPPPKLSVAGHMMGVLSRIPQYKLYVHGESDPNAPRWSPFEATQVTDEFANHPETLLDVEVVYPPSIFNIIPEAKDLIIRLLHPDPTKRLGAGPAGIEEIKQHPFFGALELPASADIIPHGPTSYYSMPEPCGGDKPTLSLPAIDWHAMKALEVVPPYRPDPLRVHAKSVDEVGAFHEGRYRDLVLTTDEDKLYERWGYVSAQNRQKNLLAIIDRLPLDYNGFVPPAPPQDNCCAIA